MLQLDKKTQTLHLPVDVLPETLAEFDAEVAEALAARPLTISIDCASVERITSSHINLLWNAHTMSATSGIELHLANPSTTLLRILHMMDLMGVFVVDRQEGDLDLASCEVCQPINKHTTLSDTFSPTVVEIDSSIERFVAFLTDLGVGPSLQMELRTIFYEIATNIRIHSGISEQDSISVQVQAGPDQLQLTFIDTGKPFDPKVSRDKMDAARASLHRQKRGFGLPMIHQFADSIAYRRDESGRNILTLSKKWHC